MREITEADIGLSAHEVYLTACLKRCPIDLTQESKARLTGAVTAALHPDYPHASQLELFESTGETWRAEVEPFGFRTAYSFWVRMDPQPSRS